MRPDFHVLVVMRRGHGMIATGGEPCVFLAIVMKPHEDKII